MQTGNSQCYLVEMLRLLLISWLQAKVCTTYKHIHSGSEMGKSKGKYSQAASPLKWNASKLSRHFSGASHCQNMFKYNLLTFQTSINTTECHACWQLHLYKIIKYIKTAHLSLILLSVHLQWIFYMCCVLSTLPPNTPLHWDHVR